MGLELVKKEKKTIFQRVKEIDQKSKGMGIGLSLVNAIINGYNGNIWVENRVKNDYTQGSKFIILLEIV
jgi:signal transduction histidine kinase